MYYISDYLQGIGIFYLINFVLLQIHPDPKSTARNLLNDSSICDDMPGKGDMEHKLNPNSPAMSASYRVISTSSKKRLEQIFNFSSSPCNSSICFPKSGDWFVNF